jgi:hypothetical protein
MTIRQKWTPKRVAELRRLAKLGFSAAKIAQMMNTTHNGILVACSKHGIKTCRYTPLKSQPVTMAGPEWSRAKK